MNALNILELSEQEIIRRNNLQQLRDLGIDPYPAAEYPTNAFSTEIKENFVDLPVVGKDEEGNDVREAATPENSRQVCIAGRIMSKRIMGKACFQEAPRPGRLHRYPRICVPHADWRNQRPCAGTDGFEQEPQAVAYREDGR